MKSNKLQETRHKSSESSKKQSRLFPLGPTTHHTSPMTQSGQTLMEIAVTIGTIAIIISVLAIITLTGLKNSQFSKNQVQATKLAQSAIDQIKTIQSRNCPINLAAAAPPPQTLYWFNDPALIWGNTSANNVNFIPTLTQSNCYLSQSATLETINSQFQRKITFLDDPINPTKNKILTVEVFWTDISGKHQSKIVTILSNN